ncbi:MAG: RtcB family protein [Nitrospinota bacterium]
MTIETVKLSECVYEIPKGAKPGMLVPGRVYADKTLLEKIKTDGSLEQVANGAMLPGIVGASLAMPDIHFGYGLPIGGVVATDVDEGGIISPGGVGFDINCGVRLVRTNLRFSEVEGRLKELVTAIFQEVPCGVGSRGKIKISHEEERRVAERGARWPVERGFGSEDDLAHTEAAGSIPGADASAVSHRAWERGRNQLGTLGSGNHFLELQRVEEIFLPAAARAFGLEEGQLVVMIHTGSRGLGHQVCTDFLADMERALTKYDIRLPDRQLACAPYSSGEAQLYLRAMASAANFAWANRQCIKALVEEAFLKALSISPSALGMRTVYDVAHNIVKIEEHEVEGKHLKLAVHRKGATRSFPSGHPEVPEDYRAVGQPVLIPGDMGRQSFLLVGTERAMVETFGSSCHGAGRALSRKAATKAAKGRAIHRELEDKGIYVRSAGRRTLVEEIPEAYKDVGLVVDVVERAGIALKVAKMRPVGVVKG